MITYLSHHGILGMKWGIRRYQNKDGTLTEAGKKRYSENNEVKEKKDPTISLYEKVWNGDTEAALEYSGVSHLDSNTDIIKKGSTFHRVTLEGEPIDEKRKYVSITPLDGHIYTENWEELILRHDKNKVVEMEYASTKEIKVATLKKVKEEIDKFIGTEKVYSIDKESTARVYGEKAVNQYLKKYGNLTISQLSLDPEENYRNLYNKKENKKKLYSGKFDKDLEIGAEFVKKRFDTVMMDKASISKITESLKKQGYDAMLDINDLDIMQYPLILISPNSSIKQTGQTHFVGKPEGIYKSEIPIAEAKKKGLF